MSSGIVCCLGVSVVRVKNKIKDIVFLEQDLPLSSGKRVKQLLIWSQ
jgi:hypothetical protein